MNRQEKRQARIERFRELAAKADKESDQSFEQATKMADFIPFGQPILVGHHSERGDRAYRSKIHNKMNKGVELMHKSKYYEEKAEAAENNTSIYLEDDNSIEKLTEKVEKLSKLQETMKATNKILFSKRTSELQKVEALQELGYSESSAIKVMQPGCYNQIGFESYQLTNNNARLKTAKERLEKAINLKSTESSEIEINRLQLFFNGKPSDEIRSELKHSGFRWTPSVGCWQSYLNKYQIDRAKNLLKSIKINPVAS
jgi:hypothetical protein